MHVQSHIKFVQTLFIQDKDAFIFLQSAQSGFDNSQIRLF